jgi:hypothetical protein
LFLFLFTGSKFQQTGCLHVLPIMHQSIPAATTPPPPGQCGAFVRLLVPTAGHLQLRVNPGAGHLSISGYYPRAFAAHGEKTAATSFLCRMPKIWLLNTFVVKQILYYIIVECWFSSVNQCLRISFSPYYTYCIYNEKLSAIWKASVSQPFADVFIWSEHDSFPCFFLNPQKNN